MEITLLKTLFKKKVIQYQPFFTQKETYLVATFFTFLIRKSFLSSYSLCKLLTIMAGF